MAKKESSEDVKKIVGHLINCSLNGTIALYEDLEKLVPNILEYRYKLDSALRIVLNNHGYMFKCVTSVGYRPVENNGKVQAIGATRFNRIKSQVRKGQKELKTVEYAALETKEKINFNSVEIKLGVQAQLLDHKNSGIFQKAAESKVFTGKVELDFESIKAGFKELAKI